MFRYEHLEEELVEAEYLLRSGQPRRALERLNYLLGNQEPQFEGYALNCASILRVMAEAAQHLGDIDTSRMFFERAIQLMKSCDPIISPDHTENFMKFAEFLAAENRRTEAMQLADLALECMVAKNSLFMVDDLADFLRRYARIARKLGYLQYAHYALSLGLLLMLNTSGLECILADEFIDLTTSLSPPRSSSTIDRVGAALTQAYR